MKIIFTLLIAFCSVLSFAGKSTYSKLVEVNKCWQMQTDISLSQLVEHQNLSEEEWIVYHLSSVENTLRSRNNRHLQPEQLQNRLHCLDILHAYWQKGDFPVNDRYNNRTPIFIDQYNNFCAVGFLIKETGHEGISRMIAANGKLAYVIEMQYPELIEWANENGFTKDELAWIQPTYPTRGMCAPLSKGVDGYIQEMYVDETNQFLFIGGSFKQADEDVTANNVAYITETGGTYTYHNMGEGVDGKVNAITKFDNKIFVGGSFSHAGGIEANNVSYWDGSKWNNAGCLNGTVYDLVVHKEGLYAAGDFGSCAGTTKEGFAKWNGTSWTLIPGLSGSVNTLESIYGELVLGGSFSFDGAKKVNIIKWSKAFSFRKFDQDITNEVLDIELFQDSIYAACRRSASSDTSQPILKFNGKEWRSFTKLEKIKIGENYELAVNTILIDSAQLNIGGNFGVFDGMTWLGYCFKPNYGNMIVIDSQILKMVKFKGELIYGGRFRTGQNRAYSIKIVELNGLVKQIRQPLSIDKYAGTDRQFILYPNPVQAGEKVYFDNVESVDEYELADISGKQIISEKIKNNSITLPQISSGTYFIRLKKDNTYSGASKIILQ